MSNIIQFRAIALGWEKGRNLLEEKGGPKFATDEDLALITDMETVARNNFTSFAQFTAAFLTVLKNAKEDGDDSVEAVRYWINAELDDLERRQA